MQDELTRVAAGKADPPCRACGGILKSATISFGQALREDVLAVAVSAARGCTLFLAVGTSLSVHPAAGLCDNRHRGGGPSGRGQCRANALRRARLGIRRRRPAGTRQRDHSGGAAGKPSPAKRTNYAGERRRRGAIDPQSRGGEITLPLPPHRCPLVRAPKCRPTGRPCRHRCSIGPKASGR
ncbi:MAG: Sir2 family NAD-dependent protein deacetylase [Frankiaceae bacterium]